MNILRNIGVINAIAALPGILSGPLTARPHYSLAHSAIARPQVAPTLARSAMLPAHPIAPAPDVQRLADLPNMARSIMATTPVSAPVSAPAPAPETSGHPRPMHLSASFAAPTPRLPDHASPGALPPIGFRLENQPGSVVLNAATPFLPGPYDRLSPGYMAAPKGTTRDAASRPDLQLGDAGKVPAAIPPNAPTAAAGQPQPSLETTPAPDRKPDQKTALASQGAISGRTAMLAPSPAVAAAAPAMAAARGGKAQHASTLPAITPTAELSPQQQQNFDFRPGTQIFPAESQEPAFTIDDELILQLKIRGINASDTIIAYGTRKNVYLPLGEIARILDLAIRVSDDGNYANGWFLAEAQSLTINLREQRLITPSGERQLKPGDAQAFEGRCSCAARCSERFFRLRWNRT